jgi:carboxyl-terminal processing protease
MKKISHFLKKFKIMLLVAVLAVTSFFSYSFVDNYFEVSKHLEIFATLYRELNIYYVDDTNPGKLMETGINAMLETLDPYTNYISESDIEDYRFMTTGQYGGIGALITQKGDYIVVADPYEGFPAQKAGLMAGDIILEIDGRSAVGKKTDEVSKILKGSPNTPIKLLIQREGESKPMEKVLTREEIKINSVPYSGMISEDVGYIMLSSFTESAGREVREAFTKLKNANQGLSGVILDLRGNPGGLLTEAVNISNIFIERGQEIVSTKGKIKEWDKSYKALNPAIDKEIPVVVLVNSGSASASEIVSGSLQDLDRGVVIGQRTFGKGLVQTTRPLSYNSQLKLTTAKYYTPSGRCIQTLDYSHRNEDGSVGSIPDSLIKEFKTKRGRAVYDGGGIIPDYRIEPKKYSNIAVSLMSKQLVFDYATKYRLTHQTISSAKDFKLSEAEYNDFVNFLSDKEYDYQTKSEKAIIDLKEFAEDEKYFNDIQAEYDQLKRKMMHDKQKDLQRHKEELMQLLKEEIVSRYYYRKGRIEAAFDADQELMTAINVIKDKTLYNSVIEGKFKQN